MSRIILAVALLTVGMAWGQSFEVAFVKPSGPRSVRTSNGGPATNDSERFTFTKAVLRDLIYHAYGVDDYWAQISGPGWIDSEEYDLAAKVPAGTSKEQFQLRLRNLLRERFNLIVHHETKLLPAYELRVAKNGPKLKASVLKPDAPDQPPPQPAPPGAQDKNGFPQLPPGRPAWSTRFVRGHVRMAAQQQPVSILIQAFRTSPGRPIFDKAGLTSLYDFTLEFGRPGATPADDQEPSAPDIFAAIQQQLGLRLVDTKASLGVIVVDSADKPPSEN